MKSLLNQKLGLATKLFATAVIAMSFAACNDKSADKSSAQQAVAPNSQNVTTITGAGSSFAYPIYSTWAINYSKAAKIRVNYQSIGSGAGVKQIEGNLVDFGASDYPLTAEQLKQYNLIQIPVLAGGIVLAVNLSKELDKSLVLSGDVVASIYMGEITKWNDPRIQALNPNAQLPDQDIQVLSRSDGSGTTYNFTKYLASVSPAFAQKYGYSKSVSFPVGLGGKGNEGIAAVLPRVSGSIGYLEYSYAVKLQDKLGIPAIKNQNGDVIKADLTTLANGVKNADWSQSVPDVANVNTANAWPINAVTFVLVNADSDKRGAIYDFFKYGMLDQQEATRKLDYVPIATDLAKPIISKLAPVKK